MNSVQIRNVKLIKDKGSISQVTTLTLSNYASSSTFINNIRYHTLKGPCIQSRVKCSISKKGVWSN